MFSERACYLISLGVVEDAYEIAWNYLSQCGAIKNQEVAHDKILADIMKLYNGGERRPVMLGNKAIASFSH